MKILLAAKYVPTGKRPIGGVQSWIATVRAELERLGHECAEYEPGMAAPGKADLGIFANMGLTGEMALRCKRTICISHGIIDEEKPGSADRLFFVSEGVKKKWHRQGSILRQPIDLDFWKPTGARSGGAVRFSYRGSPTLCREAAGALRMAYRHVRDATPEQARGILGAADIVFASGRAALEAMACGAPTVIYDHRSAYQGPLMGECLPFEMQHSYSGRSGYEPDLAALLAECRVAKPARDWVRMHHDARAIVAKMLA